VLGRYVRERKDLTLMDALRKMTLMPAQRLASHVPAMRGKGRIRVGADADLVAFDAAAIGDRATFEEPALPSEGVRHLVVGGSVLVRSGKLRDDIRPGAAIRVTRSSR
jgi:N-acyl-D-aspartate/D-glutamate deacylase